MATNVHEIFQLYAGGKKITTTAIIMGKLRKDLEILNFELAYARMDKSRKVECTNLRNFFCRFLTKSTASTTPFSPNSTNKTTSKKLRSFAYPTLRYLLTAIGLQYT
jgi:hypothetical protein